MNDSLKRPENKTSSSVDHEITFKDVILKFQQWWEIIRLQKLLIIFISLIFGLSAALYTKFLTKPAYTASYQLFFEEESGGLSGAMRLASTFGLGGMAGGSSSSRITVKEFLTSRNNIANAMIRDLENGRLIDRYYAEHIEENEEFAAEYQKNFGINQRYTDSTITQVYRALSAYHISTFIDKEMGTINFNVIAFNEAFAYDLASTLVKLTEEQFKNWRKEKSILAVNAFQKKVDSLETNIDFALLRLGQYEDQNNSLVSSVEKMKRMRLTIDFESLKVAYGEYVKGLEMSKVELMNLSAPFKYFDQPTYPLQKEKRSAAKTGVFGSLITGSLLILFFIGRTEFTNIMLD